MVDFAEDAGLRWAADRRGLFGFNDALGAYVGVMSYQKLLDDAKRRNQVLFEKLNLKL